MNLLSLINRKENLFHEDLNNIENDIKDIIGNANILVIGGAGSIGQAVSIEICKRKPNLLHVVDISENNLVELVRNIRSSIGYFSGEFKTFAIDCGSKEFEAFSHKQSYDFVFNLSALKHVRSEKDPFTLMRLIQVNIFNTVKSLELLSSKKTLKNYFSVSTDKATNPVNMMGASKKIMENYLYRESKLQKVSMARFANVAFSDGSLLHGFNQRILNKQPIAAPNDIKRYFITPQESGELCLISGLVGENRDIFFPKLNENLDLIKFSEIAKNYLESLNYEVVECNSEQEARDSASDLIAENKWPCYFFESDTTGEKDFEEFYTDNESLDLEKYISIGVIKNNIEYDEDLLNKFESDIASLMREDVWEKEDLLNIFKKALPNFNHLETGKNLDEKM
mgnify:CR=1 FL=1|tara:strand:- start:4322 stop:5509 length:1188 start_codon:yes stop_codon:yes gene_type:complete